MNDAITSRVSDDDFGGLDDPTIDPKSNSSDVSEVLGFRPRLEEVRYYGALAVLTIGNDFFKFLSSIWLTSSVESDERDKSLS